MTNKRTIQNISPAIRISTHMINNFVHLEWEKTYDFRFNAREVLFGKQLK